jgi:hypothetical protein
VTPLFGKSLSLSSFYSQTKKKATFREREFAFKRERKRKSSFCFGSGRKMRFAL